MYAGYAGLILCRTALTVASPSMIDDPALGLTEAGFGDLLAYGAGGALAGKLVTGAAADVIGGRRLFLLALAGMAAVTVGFGASAAHGMFMLMNFAMQATKAGGWPAMAKLIGSWFEPGRHGRIWGIVSTSSRLSSFASHMFLGGLLIWLPWRWLFYVAGTITAVLVTGLYFSLKENPVSVGLSPAETPAESESETDSDPDAEPVGGSGEKRQHWETTMAGTAWFFVKNPSVWLICAAIMALTVQMEFQNFIPLYLKRSFDVQGGMAGMAAGAFPAGSLISLLVGGVVYDKMPHHKRPLALGLLLLVGVGAVLVLRALPSQGTASSLDLYIAIAAIFVFGFAISPAYYIPMGVFSIEFGRSRSGVLIGIIDAFGYGSFIVVAPLAGRLVQRIKNTGGSWEPLLTQLAVVSLASAALMTAFMLVHQKWLDKADR